MWCRIIDISVTEFSDQEMKRFLKGQREMCQASMISLYKIFNNHNM